MTTPIRIRAITIRIAQPARERVSQYSASHLLRQAHTPVMRIKTPKMIHARIVC